MKIRNCAGGIVLGDSGTVALVRNRIETLWFFPKGHADEGETDEETARREIQEETGLTNLELIDDLGSYERPRILPSGENSKEEMKHIHMFLFAAPMHVDIHGANEIAEAAWIPLPHIVDSLENAKDRTWFTSVFQRIRQAIQRD